MATNAPLLGRVVRSLLAYRGHSPRSLEASYRPDRPPLSASAIRRIVNGEDDHLEGEDAEFKLMRLAGMLKVPPATLNDVYRNNTEAVLRLRFTDYPDGEAVQQFILDEMSADERPASNG